MALRPFMRMGLGAFLLILHSFILPAASFDFLQNLEGSQKGKAVEGVYQLKQYLQQFGYLNYDNTHAPHANDDEFDELLESAVKTYQFMYHLNVTGVLDPQTVKQMMKPRCGVPDIINGKARMGSGKNKKRQHDPHSLHTVSHFSFFPDQSRWPPSKYHLTYTFITDSLGNVDVETLRSVIPSAFQRWVDVSQFTFAEAQDGSTADLAIGFSTFDGPKGTLAESYEPTYGLFQYDSAEDWSTNPSYDQIDLESVAVHEIGHLLGLGHSEYSEAIMYPTIAPGLKCCPTVCGDCPTVCGDCLFRRQCCCPTVCGDCLLRRQCCCHGAAWAPLLLALGLLRRQSCWEAGFC